MKIGIDARVLMHDRYSGIGEYTWHLVDAMAKEGRQHEFHLWVNSFHSPSFAWHETLPRNCMLHVTRLPNKVLTMRHRIFGAPLCDTFVGGADVWWSPHFLPAPTACPKVVTVHDLSFLYYPDLFDMRRRLWHWYLNPQQQARRAQALIAVSQSTADDIEQRWSIAREKIHTIHSGVGEEFRPQNEEEIARVRSRLHLPAHFILSLGVMEPRKNLIGLVRAYDRMGAQEGGKSVALVLAGSQGWGARALDEAISRSRYKKDIFLLGFVKSQDKVALYAAADCFVYPSFFEGFGFPPLEAMACGTPAIVSHTSSLPEIVGDAALLVDPMRLEELAGAMREVLRDTALHAHLKQKGIERASQFRWQDTAQKTLRLLERTARDAV